MRVVLRLAVAGLLSSWSAGASIPANMNQPLIVMSPRAPIFEMEKQSRSGADWRSARGQSALFLSIQHGIRLGQKKTRRELPGPFFKDYARSITGLGSWGDGDGVFTNYVAHPMQGAASGFVFIHNSPGAEELEFGRSPEYWKSRIKAFGFAALYSTQFEVGPYSEATIGNVGKNHGTMGLVDFVMTPIGGFGWIIGEDFLDKFVIQRLEKKWKTAGRIRFIRVLLNPTRSFANLLRFKLPWHRPGRHIDEIIERNRFEFEQESFDLPEGFLDNARLFDYSALPRYLPAIIPDETGGLSEFDLDLDFSSP